MQNMTSVPDQTLSVAMSAVTSPMPAGGAAFPERKPLFANPRRTRRMPWWKLSALVLLALAIVAALAFHAVIAWVIVRPDVMPLKSNPLLKLGLPYEEVIIPSANGLSRIEGWHIPAADADRAVVLSHGFGANREEEWVPLYTLAGALHDNGFHVFMFDYGYVRGTDGRVMSAGLQESQELLGAVRYMKELGMRSVYVWGFSMGAGTALQAALSNTDIDGMILDSTFIPSGDTFYLNIKQYVDLPRFPSVALINMFSTILNGVNINQVPTTRIMHESYPMPILFIHGDADHRAPVGLIQTIASRQQNPQSGLWVIPYGQHELLYRAEPETYLKKAFAFFALADRSAVATAGESANETMN